MMTDPIADMLTRIRNAQAARHREVVVPFSKLKHKIALILERERYLKGVAESGSSGARSLRLELQYNEQGEPAISAIRRVSTPGRRIYSQRDTLPRVLSGYGIALVSTPAGLMTNREAAKRGLGGEVICEVY